MIVEDPRGRKLQFKDGTLRYLTEDEIRRVQYPNDDADWALRLSLCRSQRPRLLLGENE